MNIKHDENEDNNKEQEILDCIVIGAGPAGVAASLYMLRYGHKTVMIAESFGGQIMLTPSVENFVGINKIKGQDLIVNMRDQFNANNGKFIRGRVREIKEIYINEKRYVSIKTESNQEFKSKVVLIATGGTHKRLDVPGEDELFGDFIHTCVLCDSLSYRGKSVAIVGGGNKGAEDVIELMKIATKVVWINKYDEPKCDEIILQRIMNMSMNFKNLEIIKKSTIKNIKNTEDKKMIKISTGDQEIVVDGLFLAIGSKPNSKFCFSGKKDNNGYIIVDGKFETSFKNVFAAGEVSDNFYRQIMTSIGDGVKCAINMHNTIEKMN